jgi:ABC-2 type transport system permease protein
MRRSQVWSIALKDLADFRTSKYAMYSIVIPPILLGSILPLFYVAQFQAALSEEPYAMDLSAVQPPAGDPSGQVLAGVHILDRAVTDAKFNGSLIEGSTLTRVFVEGSLLSNVTLVDSVAFACNLEGNLTLRNATLIASVYVDRADPDEAILALVLFNILLLMLMIIPAMVPTVLASYSLVGEKSTGSLEPLLATPSTDREILAGKVAAILLPTLAVCWAGGITAVAVVGFTGGDLVTRYPLPLDQFAAALVFFVPAFALLSILSNVIVSSHVTDVRAAQQIGGIVVLPVVLLFITSLSGLNTLGFVGIVVTSAVVAAADGALAVACLRMFKREEILVRWK